MRKSCFVPLFLLGWLVLFCAGCAPNAVEIAPLPGNYRAAGPRPAGETAAGVWLFRHKVRLEMPQYGVDRSFDGIMELDAANGSIRVTALAGVGMRLFALEVGPDWMRVIYLHPSMRKIPAITGHIAACLRRIWFDCFAGMPHTSGDSSPDWNISLSSNALEGGWPSVIRFTDSQAGYTVSIRNVTAQREESSSRVRELDVF